MAKTILLADDSVTIRKVVELTFMDEDYEVVAVASGDEALEQLDAVAPDIIIADIHMPGADGYEVTRASKSKRPEVPVLLLVGTFEQFDENDVEGCGAEGYLKKPFDSQELLRMVDDLLAAASAAEPEPVETEVESSFSFDDEAAPTLVAPPIIEEEAPFPVDEPAAISFEEETEEIQETATASFDSPFGVPAIEELSLEAFIEEPSKTEPAFEEPDTEVVETEVYGESEAVAVEMVEESIIEEPAVAAFEPEDGGDLSEDDVDRIARRVVEYLTDDVVRDLAWEILPDLAEIIVKARLRELEGQIDE